MESMSRACKDGKITHLVQKKTNLKGIQRGRKKER